ncbi:Down syndrome critical region protein 3, partial [Eschrichtius robustus]|nr:Down syndrome critical region protein 3 [Eschrichtius robustus]
MLSGVVVVSGKDSVQHQGVSLTVEGTVNLQLSAKSVGVFEAFYNSVKAGSECEYCFPPRAQPRRPARVPRAARGPCTLPSAVHVCFTLKPIQIINSTIEMVKPGKFPSGKTEIPFEFPLHVKGNRVLYETYHGVFVNIQAQFGVMTQSERKRAFPLFSRKKGTFVIALQRFPCWMRQKYFVLRDRLGQGGHRSAPSSVFSGAKLAVGRRPQAYTLLAWQPQQKGLFPVAQQQSCLSGLLRTPYTLRCDMRRSLLAKDLTKTCEFIVHSAPQKGKLTPSPVDFTVTPETLQNVKERALLPKFLIRGHLNSTNCVITQPLTGELVVESSEAAIKSIELQLVRVETCGCAEGYARDATEIQNIQIADGDVCRGLSVPIYMVFPRLFTCPTLETTNFKVGRTARWLEDLGRDDAGQGQGLFRCGTVIEERGKGQGGVLDELTPAPSPAEPRAAVLPASLFMLGRDPGWTLFGGSLLTRPSFCQ